MASACLRRLIDLEVCYIAYIYLKNRSFHISLNYDATFHGMVVRNMQIEDQEQKFRI